MDLKKFHLTFLLKNAQCFYFLKLWTFNYTVYDATEKTACFLWDETIADGGRNKMGSCIMSYIFSLTDSVEELLIWSHNLPSQNINLQMIMSYFTVLMLKPILKIEHKLQL